jgi:hypothetical protein
MAELPTTNHAHYAGIDPGFSGAIGVMNADGSYVQVWDMPVTTGSKDRQREIDLARLRDILRGLRALPDCVVGLEWPTTRPGEGAERSERFGRQKGYLEAMLYCVGLDYYKLAPNLWKGRLGLPGKSDPEAKRLADTEFHTYYSEYGDLVRGPRGGLRDGRCDALLIAHFLRIRTVSAMRGVVEKYGKDSPEALALLYKRSSNRGKRNRRNWL